MRGFTLIELVVYITIMSVVFGALASVVVSGNRAITNREYIDEVYASQDRILSSIRSDIDISSAMSTGSNVLLLTIGGNPVTYSVDGGALIRGGISTSTVSLPNVVVSDFVVDTFTVGSAPSGVDISMTLTHSSDSEESVFIHNGFVLYE